MATDADDQKNLSPTYEYSIHRLAGYDWDWVGEFLQDAGSQGWRLHTIEVENPQHHKNERNIIMIFERPKQRETDDRRS